MQKHIIAIAITLVIVGILVIMASIMRPRHPHQSGQPVSQQVAPAINAPAQSIAAAPQKLPPTASVDTVIAQLAKAIAERGWAAAKQADDAVNKAIGAIPTEHLAELRDALRRGVQRDRDGIIEFRVQHGNLEVIDPGRTAPPTFLKTIKAHEPFSLTPEQDKQSVIFMPRGTLTTTMEVTDLVADLRLLRIDGLSLPLECTVNPSVLTGLADAPLRYLGGTAIDKIPNSVLSRCALLERIDFSSRSGSTPQPFAALAGKASLKQLTTASYGRITAEDIVAISSLTNLLDLKLWGTELAPGVLSPLGKLASLRRLELVNLDADAQLCAALAEGAPALEELICSASKLTGNALASLAHLPALNTLRLRNNLRADAWTALAGLAHLRVLECTVPFITPSPGNDAADIDLTTLAALTNLEALNLGVPTRAPTGVVGLDRLTVKRLALLHGGIGDRYAASLQRMPRLESLRFQNANISDAGLVDVVKNPHLRDLFVSGNDAVLGACAPILLASPNLRTLYLDGRNITEAAIMSCHDAGHLEQFSYRGSQRPSTALIAHLSSWSGMVQVSLDITGMSATDQKRLNDGNTQRQTLAPKPSVVTDF